MKTKLVVVFLFFVVVGVTIPVSMGSEPECSPACRSEKYEDGEWDRARGQCRCIDYFSPEDLTFSEVG